MRSYSSYSSCRLDARDPDSALQNFEGSVTSHTSQMNRGVMIRPTQALLGRDGERYLLVKNWWEIAVRRDARSSG